MKQPRLSHDRRVLLLALLGGLPGVAVALGLLLLGDHTPRVQWTFGIFVVALWCGFAFAVQGSVVRPLQTLSNLLAALREEDFSFRARGTRGDNALAQAMFEVNALADTLREQKLGALEATALLRKVMEEIGAAVGMGGYFCTYYTELTREQKAEWIKWMDIYREEKLCAGEYLNLYDIVNDLPETHAKRANDSIDYFGPGPFEGELELRGLGKGSYRVVDFSTEELVATVTGPTARIPLEVIGNIYLKATGVQE